ncbi:MAG TPA: hypothetical protein VF514_05450 [Bacteroidota bacterium]
MRTRIIAAAVVSLLLISSRAISQSGTLSDERVIANVDSALSRLMQIQKEIKEIHPFLARLHPVAVVEGANLFIFDIDSTGTSYRFQRKEPVPFPMERGIRASFPLFSYGNRPTCIVSREVFDSLKGYATIFHEFIHCTQALTCENDLKQELHIAQAAAAARDYSWEINHRFPYNDTVFVEAYSRLMRALGDRDAPALLQSGRDLKHRLAQDDYEYMVWVEWKEGFARYIENKIRLRYNLQPNLAGREQPFDRVTFYYGGERIMTYLAAQHGGIFPHVKELFGEMFAPSEGK